MPHAKLFSMLIFYSIFQNEIGSSSLVVPLEVLIIYHENLMNYATLIINGTAKPKCWAGDLLAEYAVEPMLDKSKLRMYCVNRVRNCLVINIFVTTRGTCFVTRNMRSCTVQHNPHFIFPRSKPQIHRRFGTDVDRLNCLQVINQN